MKKVIDVKKKAVATAKSTPKRTLSEKVVKPKIKTSPVSKVRATPAGKTVTAGSKTKNTDMPMGKIKEAKHVRIQTAEGWKRTAKLKMNAQVKKR
jgi:hypothetical protein